MITITLAIQILMLMVALWSLTDVIMGVGKQIVHGCGYQFDSSDCLMIVSVTTLVTLGPPSYGV